MGFFSGLLENNPTLFVVLCCLVIAVAVAVVILILTRRVRPKNKPLSGVISCPEDLIGMSGVVEETVDGDSGTGLVMIDGNGWSARTVYADEVLEVGTKVTVVAIEGVKVIVRADA